MPTSRETILAALRARLSTLPATKLRGDVLPERVPTDGLLILRNGERGEPEVTLSPLRNHYQHRAEIEAVVQGGDPDAALDTLSFDRHGGAERPLLLRAAVERGTLDRQQCGTEHLSRRWPSQVDGLLPIRTRTRSSRRSA